MSDANDELSAAIRRVLAFRDGPAGALLPNGAAAAVDELREAFARAEAAANPPAEPPRTAAGELVVRPDGVTIAEAVEAVDLKHAVTIVAACAARNGAWADPRVLEQAVTVARDLRRLVADPNLKRGA